ncbi:MAG: flap endonuclease [Ruminococcaceae bacterium]|nr:flap endonuclease [Oscillospiraceae bacterium]
MNKLLIVDGHNLLFQMFFGMPARIVNKDGKAIQGTLGFTGALLKIIKMVKPTHVAVLFDGERHNPRNDLDESYKANRIDYDTVSEEENPFTQLNDIYNALDFLGIKHCETTVCETDDVIAAYALKYGKNNEIVISSFDSDFFQLITNNVKVLRYRGDNTQIYDTEFFFNKFGILPDFYADYKSLTGDTADNIKGADKIGPKTAAVLVNQFGGVENIIANAEKITRPSIKASVIENTERIRLNYKLIKLCDCADLPFCLEELQYTYNGTTTNEVLIGIGLK